MTKKPRIAIVNRYGAADHTELFHALPSIIKNLSQVAEVHYFSMRSPAPVPDLIAQHANIHHLPLTCRRTSNFDKFLKTLLWPFFIPWIALRCRALKCSVIYIDETIPLVASLIKLFYKGKLVYTIADIFVDIYKHRILFVKIFSKAIQSLDEWGWRRAALIITRTNFIHGYLQEKEISADRLRAIYDSNDFSLYYPLSAGERKEARTKYGFKPDDIVLSHHGILHPNKGNDRIIRALADLIPEHPNLKYLLIGDGPEFGQLQKLASELGIQDNYVATGWLESPVAVNEALNASDIGLAMRIGLPSDHFHLTGALVHAMATGLPVMAARLGGMSEVVKENENGLLFDPADMNEFKEKLLML
ncbi:MAG: glycosyltransferase family 4 protein, partial [Lentisphaerae bacterium]|nr:glycosyltransferase family 4 protein [Lentisphaerota bacterium]